MKKVFTLLIGVFLVFFLFVGCTSSDTVFMPSALPASPSPTEIKILPTPGVPGDPFLWQDLYVSMDSAEITGSFTTEFGTKRMPSAGQKFLWVHIRLDNMGKSEIALPAAEHFSALYADSEFKPTYGHRQGYADYTALTSPLFPGQAVDAWLRFDIPETAELKNIWVIFMPESSQVSVMPSSPDYPWGGDHPEFVWTLEP
jgi:hypothetical protein